jgi:hypothetical protein
LTAQEEDKGKLLRSLLENPALLQGALSLAGSFLSEEDDERSPSAAHRRALLLAVKPYLGQTRQAHLETLLQVLQIVEHFTPKTSLTDTRKGEQEDETERPISSV